MRYQAILLACLFAFSTAALAEPMVFKVDKVKGKKAVVSFTGPAPEAGSSYTVGGGGGGGGGDLDDMDSGSGGGEAGRAHKIGLGAEMNFVNSKAANGSSVNASTMSISALYGWNWQTMEFGPKFEWTSATVASGTTTATNTTMLLGGFFDYNLIPNVMKNTAVYGLRVSAGFGQNKNGSSASVSVMEVEPGFVYKWFGLNKTFSLVGFAGYYYERLTVSGSSTTVSGPKLALSIETYY